jgi:excisionase family DNA binding protein
MQLFTVREVAEILKLNPGTVYRLVEANKIPHIRLDNSRKAIRVPSRLLNAYIEEHIQTQVEASIGEASKDTETA